VAGVVVDEAAKVMDREKEGDCADASTMHCDAGKESRRGCFGRRIFESSTLPTRNKPPLMCS
jgi:hypothetical protein